jgi:hypothetical protein
VFIGNLLFIGNRFAFVVTFEPISLGTWTNMSCGHFDLAASGLSCFFIPRARAEKSF